MPFKRPNKIQFRIAVMVGIALALMIYIDAYVFNWQYTGFGPKTIWDWLELLVIPLVLAVGGYIFTRADKQAELERAEQHTRTERDIAEQRAQDALLQTYLDQMTELLLDRKLRESQPGSEVRQVAQTRTLIALRRLDSERRTILMQFLRASQLVGLDEAQMIVDFRGTNLSKVDLSNTQMDSINLSDAILIGANLQRTDLTRSKLQRAKLRNVNLAGALLWDTDLSAANLWGSNLSGASLIATNLAGVDLSEANLTGADLREANLQRASLRRSNLQRADLQKANLQWADLTGTDLTGASLQKANLQWITLAPERLAQTKSLKGATMPDGSIHD